MKNSKYKIGDEVWFLYHGTIHYSIVKHIDPSKPNFPYQVKGMNIYISEGMLHNSLDACHRAIPIVCYV